MTIVIYIMTLIPALFFEDLGPVLSLSGAVGASCLAYIAPGMAYLGVNGSAFLNISYELIGQKPVQQIELPVAGERTIGNENLELPVSGTPAELTTAPPPAPFKCKPLWWYIVGMPVWCGIASLGHTRLSRHIRNSTSDVSSELEETRREELSPPTRFDFAVAIFFILFGVIALACGLGTNILIQMNKFAGSVG